MNADHVIETAVGIMGDLAVAHAIQNGGNIDLLGILGDVFALHEEMGADEWQKGKDKITPLIHDIFVAYLRDRRIDLAGLVEGHTARANGEVQ